MKRKNKFNEETPLNYGKEQPLSQLPQDQIDIPVDMIDETIWGLMDELVAGGNSESSAESLVQGAIDKLVKDEIIPPIPEYDEPDGVKAAWCTRAVSEIKNYLRQKGETL